MASHQIDWQGSTRSAFACPQDPYMGNLHGCVFMLIVRYAHMQHYGVLFSELVCSRTDTPR